MEPIDPKQLAEQCERLLPWSKSDQFYGPAHGMALGAGVIVRGVRVPIYLPENDAYATGATTALVLTHECDIDPNNIRPFSDKALVAPIIRLDKFISSSAEHLNSDGIRALATNIASGKTNRLFFLPSVIMDNDALNFGGLLDFNYITSCGMQTLLKSDIVCSLTGYAINVIDKALQNHLFREKSDRAPLPR